MALSNSQYDAIMREYGKRQMENQHSQEARKKEVYEKVPAVKELEAVPVRLARNSSTGSSG